MVQAMRMALYHTALCFKFVYRAFGDKLFSFPEQCYERGEDDHRGGRLYGGDIYHQSDFLYRFDYCIQYNTCACFEHTFLGASGGRGKISSQKEAALVGNAFHGTAFRACRRDFRSRQQWV